MSNVKKIVIQSYSNREITATEIQINNKQITQSVSFVVSGFFPGVEMTDTQLQVLVNGNKTYTNWVTTTFHSALNMSGFITMTLSTPIPYDELDEVYVYSVYQNPNTYRMQYNIILYDENNVEIAKRTTQKNYDTDNVLTAYSIGKFNEPDTIMNLESIQEKQQLVRYIRDYLKGSNINPGNHWVEINAYDKGGVNVALNKPVTSNQSVVGGNPLSVITDGDTNTNNFAEVTNGVLAYVEIDLEDIFIVDKITVWHYYADGRTYNDTRTQVSVDGITWTDIFNSATEGTYEEPTDGSGKTSETLSINNSTFIGSPLVSKVDKTCVGNIQNRDNESMVEYVQINTHTGEISKSSQLYNSTWDSIKVSNTDNDEYLTFGTPITPPGIVDVDTGYQAATWDCFINGWYIILTTEGVSEFRPFINGSNWVIRYKITGTTASTIYGYFTFIRKN